VINLLGVKSEQPSWGKYIINPWAKFKSGFFLPQEILFTHGKMFLGLKKSRFKLILRVDHFSKSATHYFTPKKFDHFCPQRDY